MGKTYTRVAPRDLFNEAKLLKCLGVLALRIHDGVDDAGRATPAWLRFEEDADRYRIEQDPSDGALRVASGIRFLAGNKAIRLQTPYNSKDAYPLQCVTADGDIDVFDASGRFTEEFLAHVGKYKPPAIIDDPRDRD